MRRIVTWVGLVWGLLLSGESNAGDTYCLLQFSATWCGPCQQQAKWVAKSSVPARLRQLQIPSYDIDIDEKPQFADGYKVTAVPTCILVRVGADGKGTVVRRQSGLMTEEQLLQLVEPPAPAAVGPVWVPPH